MTAQRIKRNPDRPTTTGESCFSGTVRKPARVVAGTPSEPDGFRLRPGPTVGSPRRDLSPNAGSKQPLVAEPLASGQRRRAGAFD